MEDSTRARPIDRLPLLLLVAVIFGCAHAQPALQLPLARQEAGQQLVFYCDFMLPPNDPLLSELVQLRTQISQTLDLPTSEQQIHVYLFETSDRYQTYIKENYPGFPDRRAFFVKTPARLGVFACWGDRMAEDLRHEVSHGYLHAALRDVPLWVDEGLAEYFEVADHRPAGHLDMLVAAIEKGWRPDASKLSGTTSVKAMQQRDYAEAWAWVHFLLHTNAQRRKLLTTYLAALRTEESPQSLAAIILENEPDAALQLTNYLRQLDASAAN